MFKSKRVMKISALPQLSSIVLLLVVGWPLDSEAIHPDCDFCTKPATTSSDALLSVSVKWCGLSESLTVADPSLMCQTSFKTAMWRRHERASECVWIPQAKITLRSGGAIQKEDYTSFADPDTGEGNPGDVRVDEAYAGSERMAIYEQCDMEWSDQPKGLIAINASRLIDEDGNVDARGIAFTGSITMPFLTIADQENLQQLNERSLAHEAGHILSLGHVNVNGRLMQTGGTGSTLTDGEIDQARQYLADNTILDPPSDNATPTDLVDFFYDPPKDAEVPHLDIRKVVLVDNTASKRDFALHMAVAGLYKPLQTDTSYAFALDTDNDPKTGMSSSDIVEQMSIVGAELVGVIRFGERGADRGELTLTADIDGRPVQVYVDRDIRMRTVEEVICDPVDQTISDKGRPIFSEFSVPIPAKVLFALGLPDQGRLFPDGLRVQTAAFSPGAGPLDLGPSEPAVLDFPAVVFPTAEAPKEVTRGETITVTVRNMPAKSKLATFFGDQAVAVATETDESGTASFDIQVPVQTPYGETLLTVGIPDPANAITADTTVNVVPRDDLKPDELCALSIEELELALRQLDEGSVLGAIPAIKQAIRRESRIVHWDASSQDKSGLEEAILKEVAALVKLEVAATTDADSAEKLIKVARGELETAAKIKKGECQRYGR